MREVQEAPENIREYRTPMKRLIQKGKLLYGRTKMTGVTRLRFNRRSMM